MKKEPWFPDSYWKDHKALVRALLSGPSIVTFVVVVMVFCLPLAGLSEKVANVMLVLAASLWGGTVTEHLASSARKTAFRVTGENALRGLTSIILQLKALERRVRTFAVGYPATPASAVVTLRNYEEIVGTCRGLEHSVMTTGMLWKEDAVDEYNIQSSVFELADLEDRLAIAKTAAERAAIEQRKSQVSGGILKQRSSVSALFAAMPIYIVDPQAPVVVNQTTAGTAVPEAQAATDKE